MKSASLRHLLLLSGRAISDEVPETADAIAEIGATLSVTREGRSDFRLVYERGDEKCETSVPSARFDFYRRGDVAALNEKRPASLDLRAQNWRAAHVTWAELLDRSEVAGLDTPPALRIRPSAAAPGDLLGQVLDVVGVVVPLAAAVVTRRITPLLVGAVAAAATVADTNGGRRFAGVAAAASAVAAPPSGAGILAAAAAVVSAFDVAPAPVAIRSAALPVLAGAAAATVSRGFGSAVVVGALSDGLAAGIGRRDPMTIRSVGSRLVGVAAGSVSFRRRGGVAVPANPLATAALSGLLVAETAVRVMEGSRDRLAPVVHPLAIALAAAWRRDRRLAVALGVGVVAASAARRVVAQRDASRPVDPLPVAVAGTPVSLRSRGAGQTGAR